MKESRFYYTRAVPFSNDLIMAAKLASAWDLSVDNPKGELTLVVEVKRKINASPE